MSVARNVRGSVRFGPALAWMLVIFLMSAQSRTPAAPGLSDEIAAIAGHLVAYGVLSALLAFALAGLRRPTTAITLISVLLATVYGVTDEIHQSFVPGRHADPFDVFVDFAGATTAVMIWAVAVQRLTK